MSDEIDINSAIKKTRNLLFQCQHLLPEDAVNQIEHYISHNEPEIAFEGLFIDLIKTGAFPENIDKASCIELGKQLKLNKESVLKDEFWEEFIVFLKQ